MTSVNNN